MGASTSSGPLPPVYFILFLIVEPSVILVSLVALFISPGNFFTSLAPDTSSGLLFQRDLSLNTCAAVESWNTPQLRVLLYQFSGALAFSAIIEPSL
ncbi:hypothetical protein CDV31_016850, partial [Fusarium ambrosium]